MIIYLSGPITGVENYEEMFAVAEQGLRGAGHVVINPCNAFRGQPGITYEQYMRFHVASMLTADGIYMMPGWEKSRGARFELSLAQMIGLEVFMT